MADYTTHDLIPYVNILQVKANQHQSVIYLVDGDRVTVPYSISHVERFLPTCYFRRVHRCHVVNLRHVTGIINRTLRVGDLLVSVGPSYWPTVCSLLNVVTRPTTTSVSEGDDPAPATGAPTPGDATRLSPVDTPLPSPATRPLPPPAGTTPPPLTVRAFPPQVDLSFLLPASPLMLSNPLTTPSAMPSNSSLVRSAR